MLFCFLHKTVFGASLTKCAEAECYCQCARLGGWPFLCECVCECVCARLPVWKNGTSGMWKNGQSFPSSGIYLLCLYVSRRFSLSLSLSRSFRTSLRLFERRVSVRDQESHITLLYLPSKHLSHRSIFSRDAPAPAHRHTGQRPLHRHS